MATEFDPATAPVSVFYPSSPAAATRLKKANLFTRLSVIATPDVVKQALDTTAGLSNTFCLSHYNDILVFDINKEAHTSHIKTILQMLKDKGLQANIHRCAFYKPGWAEAGFHIAPVAKPQDGKQAFMVLLRDHVAPEARQCRFYGLL